jgi:hypothetical protein
VKNPLLINPQKYFQKPTFFCASKATTQLTTKNQQLTTFPPQKTIKKTHKYAQPPCKNAAVTTPKTFPYDP